MDRTIPRFIPPLPNTVDQNRCKDLAEHHTVSAAIHPPVNVLPPKDTTTRPCAIIGPDGTVPQYPKIEGYPSHVWPQARNGAVSYYRTTPNQFYSEQMHPPRNISPRHTFQENMSRIVVPSPTEMKMRSDVYLPNNLQNSNFVLPNGTKRNISPSVKFCEGAVLVSPHSVEVLRPQYHKNNDSSAGRHDIQGPPLTSHSVPITNVHEIPYTHPNNLYAYSTDYQRYPHEYQSHGIHVVKNNPTYQTYSEPQPPYYIANDYSGNTYARVNNIRYEPYPQVKDKYIHTRYEYPYQVQNDYPTPQGVSQKLHETKKKIIPQPADMRYYQLPQKYVETHPYISNPEYRTKISNRRNPNGVPYHASNYPTERYTNQAKIFEFNIYDKNSQIPGNPRPVAESTKIKIDYYNHCKTLPYADTHYNHENSHNFGKSNIPVYNYPMKPPHVHHSYTLNSNYQRPVETHNVDSDTNHQKLYYNQKYSTYNPLAKIPTEFSPNIISPTESNGSFDSLNTVSHQQYQEDGGYVSQCSTASGQSNDFQVNGIGKNYDRVYNTMHTRPVNPFAVGSIPQNTDSIEVKQMKTQNVSKCSIDLRQFVETWDEEFEDQTQPKALPETIAHKNVDMISLEANSLLTSEELYVLDKVTISKDDLHKYEHIQKVTKLPDNIKDYEHIENTKRNKFTKNISGYEMEQTRSTDKLDYFYDYNQNGGIIKSNGPRVQIIKSHASMNEPIDVESKISQSIIHKEVRCNFEIKPCSPGKQDQMSSAGEQKIDKDNTDCNLNDRIRKSYNDRNVNINIVTDTEKNTQIKEIMHINFDNGVKSNMSKTMRDCDTRVDKNRVQPVGSSLPQIESEHVAKNPSSNSVNDNLSNWNLHNNRNRSIDSKPLNVLEECKHSDRDQTVVSKIENIKSDKDEKVQILSSHQNTQRHASDIFLNEIFLNISEKYQSANSNQNFIQNSEIIKKKLEHTPAKFLTKTQYGESCIFNVSDLGSNGNTPSVIKSNYGIKPPSPIVQNAGNSNNPSISILSEKTMDLTENTDKKTDEVLEEANVTSQLNDIAQLHISDISEIIADANQLDKIPVTAEIFSNTDSSKIIHTTLECVIEAIESSIDDSLTNNGENFNSNTVDSVIYPNLAIDYSTASLNYESVKESHNTTDNVAPATISDIQSNITNDHLIVIAEEKSDNTTNADPLIESKLNDVKKNELLEADQITQSLTQRSKIKNPPKLQELSEEKICEIKIFQLPDSDLNLPKDNLLQIKTSSDRSSIDLPILQSDDPPSAKINSNTICHDLSIKEHLCPEIVSTDINQEAPVLISHSKSLLCSDTPAVDSSDAPVSIPVDSETLESSLLESIVTDTIKNSTLLQYEDDINESLHDSNSANLTMIEQDSIIEESQGSQKNTLTMNDNLPSEIHCFEIKCNISNKINTHPTINITEDTKNKVCNDGSQLEFENTNELTSTDDSTYLGENSRISMDAGNFNDISNAIMNSADSLLQPSLYHRRPSAIEQDTEDLRNDKCRESSTSAEKDSIITASNSSSVAKASIRNMGKLKNSKSEDNTFMENLLHEDNKIDLEDKKSIKSDIGLNSMVVKNNMCDDKACKDHLICSNSDKKFEDLNIEKALTLTTTFSEEECDSYSCDKVICLSTQSQDSLKNEDKISIVDESELCKSQYIPPVSNPQNVGNNSRQDSNNRTIIENNPISLSNETSESDGYELNSMELNMENSKIEHDGLELGGCWIDDIACVETVVSEEAKFSLEITETNVNSNQSWDSISSDDDSVSHMLHYHIDSVGNILKDTNGNVILTNPLFDISNNRKKKITGENMDTTKTELNEDLQECKKDQVVLLSSIIEKFPLSKDLQSKNTSRDLEISERYKRKTPEKDAEPKKKEISHKKRRKRLIESECNETKHKSVRKIDSTDRSDEEKHNTENSEKYLFKNIQSNHSDGRILTKGAQKYIPPIMVDDLKVHLPLPEQKLLSLKLSSLSHQSDSKDISVNYSKEHSGIIKRMVLPKKPPKPKFEDVLKSIDISTVTWSKKRLVKIKQTVPKMVIKKNKHGSHYTSVNTEKTSAPDMTGNKWQPLVLIQRIARIENMIKNKESQIVYYNVYCSPAQAYRPSLCPMSGKQESTQHHNKHRSVI